MIHNLLLVDDDTLYLESTCEFLKTKGFQVDTADSGARAVELVRANPYRYSVVILDYQMPGQDGAETVKKLTALNPDLFVLIFSGDSSRNAVLLTTRSGARGFVDKAEGPDIFLAEIERWCRKFEETHLTIATHLTPSEKVEKIASLGLVGRSEALLELATLIERLKVRQGPVLLLGESGTGKELVARALHKTDFGQWRAVNCAAFSSNPQLMSATLFGHVRGAFTGATHDKKGVIEEAQGGTVFLDEIYALPVSCQMELLRALQEKAITPVGGTQERKVEFRLIAAAKPDLLEAVKAEKFTLDLFYRISRTILHVAPLRERPEDIEPLVHHFCEKWSRENSEHKTFLYRTVPYLESYPWPGNVRELENLVYSLLDLTPADKIAPEHLGAEFFQHTKSPASSIGRIFSLKDRLDEVEKAHLISVLQLSRTLREASRRMEVSLTTVLRLLKKHGVQPEKHLGSAREVKESVREILSDRKGKD